MRRCAYKFYWISGKWLNSLQLSVCAFRFHFGLPRRADEFTVNWHRAYRFSSCGSFRGCCCSFVSARATEHRNGFLQFQFISFFNSVKSLWQISELCKRCGAQLADPTAVAVLHDLTIVFISFFFLALILLDYVSFQSKSFRSARRTLNIEFEPNQKLKILRFIVISLDLFGHFFCSHFRATEINILIYTNLWSHVVRTFMFEIFKNGKWKIEFSTNQPNNHQIFKNAKSIILRTTRVFATKIKKITVCG